MEDNAEFGLGLRLALDQKRQYAARLLHDLSSEVGADLAREVHLHHREGVTIFQCQMTPVLGTARWLSRSNQLRTPFFGSAMLECGEQVD